MITLEQLPLYLTPLEDMKKICMSRAHGSIYRTGNTAIKVAHHWTQSGVKLLNGFEGTKRAIRESRIHNHLYEQEGITVPQSYGAFKFKKYDEEFPGFTMDFIDGFDIRYLSKAQQDSLHQRIFPQLKIAKQLGYQPSSDVLDNAIWVPKQARIYLIDFTLWQITNPNLREVIEGDLEEEELEESA